MTKINQQEKKKRELKFNFMAKYSLSEKEFDEQGYKVLKCNCGARYCSGWIIEVVN